MLVGVRRTTSALLATAVAWAIAGAPATGAAAPARARPAAPARDRRRAEAEVRTLRERVAEASAEESALLDRLDQVQSRRRQLDARMAVLERHLVVVRAEAGDAESHLEQVHGELVRAQARLVAAGGDLAQARGELRHRAVAAYVGNPASATAEAMLRAGSLRRVAAAAGYLRSVLEAQTRVVDRYRARRGATAEARAALETVKDEALARRAVVVARRSALEAVRVEQDSTRREVLAEEDGQRRLVGEVRSRRAEFESRIAALRAESGSIGRLLRERQVGPRAGPGRPGLLASPLPGAQVTSGFGPRAHPVLGGVRVHDGIDYRAGAGTAIHAAAAGTVVHAGPRGGYGNATIVDHGGGLATVYAHQSAAYVAPGARVERGQVIGAVGSTGLSTGPHLHFEVRVAGEAVDPRGWLQPG